MSYAIILLAKRVYGRMKSAIRENSVNSKAGKSVKIRRIRVIVRLYCYKKFLFFDVKK